MPFCFHPSHSESFLLIYLIVKNKTLGSMTLCHLFSQLSPAYSVDLASRAIAASTARGDLNISTTLGLSKLHPSSSTPSPEPHPNHTSFLVDTSNWNTTLTELRQSIQQVREDLASSQRRQRKRGHAHGTRSKDKEGQLLHSDDDDLDISEQSLLSRSELSTHTSHSALVHS